MSSVQKQSVAPDEAYDDAAGTAPGEAPEAGKPLAAPVRRAIHRTRQWLLNRQDADGSWCAELEGDTILESETILLLAFLGHEDRELARRFGGLSGREAASRRRLGDVSRRGGRDQRQREGLFRPEADRPRPERRVHAAGPRRPSWPTAGPTPSTASRAFIWPCWAKSPMSNARPCRRKSCCCPSGSRSISTPSAPGRGRSSCRCRSSRRCGRSAGIEPRLGIRELFLREPEDWPPLRCPGLARRDAACLSWDRFFRTIDRLLKWCQRRRLLPLRRRPWRPPSGGCSPASTAATAWARSIRPWSGASSP